jgi:hypothetical protein
MVSRISRMGTRPIRIYNSGKITQGAIGATLPNTAGSYYLVFDNRYSLITPKAVQVNAVLRYTQLRYM